VGVTVNQPGQQGGAAQIDGLDAGRRIGLHSRRRTNFFDLAVFNQPAAGESTFPVRGSSRRPAFIRVTGAGDWAMSCPVENRAKNDAAKSVDNMRIRKKIGIRFIRVTLLNLFELERSGFSSTSLGAEVTPSLMGRT